MKGVEKIRNCDTKTNTNVVIFSAGTCLHGDEVLHEGGGGRWEQVVQGDRLTGLGIKLKN